MSAIASWSPEIAGTAAGLASAYTPLRGLAEEGIGGSLVIAHRSPYARRLVQEDGVEGEQVDADPYLPRRGLADSSEKAGATAAPLVLMLEPVMPEPVMPEPMPEPMPAAPCGPVPLTAWAPPPGSQVAPEFVGSQLVEQLEARIDEALRAGEPPTAKRQVLRGRRGYTSRELAAIRDRLQVRW